MRRWSGGEPGHLGQALGLEGLDLVGMAQRQADVVEAVDQAVLAEGLDVERQFGAVGLITTCRGRSTVSW
jgi:hypothetical protein